MQATISHLASAANNTILAASIHMQNLLASSHTTEGNKPACAGAKTASQLRECSILNEGGDIFWGSGLGIMVRGFVGAVAIGGFIWAFVAGLKEAAGGRGGGATQVVRKIVLIVSASTLLSMIAILPTLILGIFSGIFNIAINFLASLIERGTTP